jgi:hypothetical protein
MADKRAIPVLVGEMYGDGLHLAVARVGGQELALDTAEKKRELITRSRAGEQVELEVHARTFRQKDGEPNRNYLRFKPTKLTDIGASFKGMPVLVDHNKWEQSARIGTIIDSVAEEQAHGWVAFKQTLHIVKPAAVQSVLDGTLDRFSIGWHPTGPILCSLHQVDVRSYKERAKAECWCWPGDKVSTEVDGKKSTHVVEYEFQNADGIEVSAVNVPAVKGTRIEDVRSALTLELSLAVPQVHAPPPGQETQPMKILATILGLAALATPEDEAAAVRAVEDLKRGKLAAEQERDAARTELVTVKADAAKERETSLKAGVDAMIDRAYKGGKLRFGRDDQGNATPSTRESRLRRIAKEDGLAALQAELDDMPVIVALGQRAQGIDQANVRDREDGANDDNLATVAEQLGHKPDELAAYRAKLYGEG